MSSTHLFRYVACHSIAVGQQLIKVTYDAALANKPPTACIKLHDAHPPTDNLHSAQTSPHDIVQGAKHTNVAVTAKITQQQLQFECEKCQCMWQANDQQESHNTHTRTDCGVIYAYLMYFNGAHIYFSLLL